MSFDSRSIIYPVSGFKFRARSGQQRKCRIKQRSPLPFSWQKTFALRRVVFSQRGAWTWVEALGASDTSTLHPDFLQAHCGLHYQRTAICERSWGSRTEKEAQDRRRATTTRPSPRHLRLPFVELRRAVVGRRRSVDPSAAGRPST